MIIALGHKARVGKDTVADFLVNQYGFRRIAFADAVKRTTAVAFELSDEQVFTDKKIELDPYWDLTPAQLLQFVGTELFRDHVSPDHWVRVVMRKIDAEPEDTNWVITDCRFPNEATAVKARGGLVIRVDRDERARAAVGRDTQHPSETALDGYTDWDWIIDNNGTKQALFEAVETIMDTINEPRGQEVEPWSIG